MDFDLRVERLFDVSGKVALVTGGGGGIGLMITEGLVQNGATVYICSRKADVCQKEAARLTAAGPGKCIALSSADFGKGKVECDRVVDELKSRGVTKLNILVNNSGKTWGGPLNDFDEQKGFDSVMAINVKAPFYLTMACAPLLVAAGEIGDPARVINIGSILGIMSSPAPTPSYDISKAAIHHLTKKLAVILTREQITVNAIAPGLVPSKMGDQVLQVAGMGETQQKNSLKRIGQPGDMAGAVLYLSSKAGSWVSGAIIPIDGCHHLVAKM
mmetsp:Transcript_39327/g.54822  ORF Transcript_39327/g.54822 Transcript_39327/m.54822 type:complete len:272 (+) Transcript_39327:151-966(+)|eukprot:CAMPEP_0201492354 /NCGR_PEP_ID=MMETSP0151_2-20130828/32786_1 /ASSEMBLY_ACC=CAM_ASM_000257 /TAXON_ID=200890 /ORGANISM="Paramoeba atlantica, Strain 621/1 / CCAP 1560/9" /LENGTH=271 /DNA_ID=CAMNT_0047879123 /DNA_START=105 /DNA_END=920 /DNA_ORIENTATION=-